MTLKKLLKSINLTKEQSEKVKTNLDAYYNSLEENEIDNHNYRCATEKDYEDKFLLDIYLKSNIELILNIVIDKNISLKNLRIHLMDDHYNVLEVQELKLRNNYLYIDLYIYKFICLEINNQKSEILILSENLSKLVIKYNKLTMKNDINLGYIKKSNYGKIDSIILKDEVNLSFRKDKEKLIHILQPYDYNPNKKYGVIIMFDAQNIYNIGKVGNYTEKNDPYGGWQVEASLEKIREKYHNEFIVIGIENADYYREIELTPSTSNYEFKEEILSQIKEDKLLKGQLEKLRKFINDTLLPFVSKQYNVDLDTLGIVGSSCGGLASFYVGLNDYKKYKFVFTFTPATGFIKDESLRKLYKKIDFINNKNNLPYIFFYQGNNGELENLLYKLNSNFVSLLINEGYPRELIDQYIEESAEHNETMWRYGFNYAINKFMKSRGN